MARKLHSDTAEQLRAGVSSVPAQECKTTTPQGISATVVLDRCLYDEKMKEILSDNNTYRRLKRDPTTRIEKSVATKVKQLHKDGLLPDRLKDKLTPTYSNPPQIYGVPKIHKDNNPLPANGERIRASSLASL